MQETITEALAKIGSGKLTEKELTLYYTGIKIGIDLVSSHLESNKIIPSIEKTDPLYSYTWNFVVERLIERLNLLTGEVATILDKISEEPK